MDMIQINYQINKFLIKKFQCSIDQIFLQYMQSIEFKIIYLNNKVISKNIEIKKNQSHNPLLLKNMILSEYNVQPKNFKVYTEDLKTQLQIQCTQQNFSTQDFSKIIIKEVQSPDPIKQQKSDLKKIYQSQKQGSAERSSIIFEQASNILEDEQSFMQSQPQIPPNVYGEVKICRKLKCFYKEAYLQLNPEICIINIYKSKSDFPKKPYQTIPLSAIGKIKKLKKTPCFSKKSYLMIQCKQNTYTFCFYDKQICGQWMKHIKDALIFSQYFEAKISQYMETTSLLKQKYGRPEGKIQLVDSIEVQSASIKESCSSDKNKSSVKKSNKKSSIQHKSPSRNLKSPSKLESKASSSKQSNFSEFINEKKEIILLQHFTIQKKIGSGSFGFVYLGMHKKTGVYYAIKQLSKNTLIQKRQLKYALTQLQILKNTQNPFILTMSYAFQTKENLYMALTHCPNGTLKELICQTGGLGVQDAILYLCQIIIAIQYLHSLDIIYRDLKPQNILISKDYHITLSDFGLCKAKMRDDDKAYSFCGSPAYVSPQLLNKQGTSKMSDIYGIGAVFYEMLHGTPMYVAQQIAQVFEKIKLQQPEINQDLPQEVRDFLKQTLQKQPQKRLKNLRSHKIFENISWKQIYKKNVSPHLKCPKLKSGLDEIEINYQIDQDYNETNYMEDRVENWLYSLKSKQIDQ